VHSGYRCRDRIEVETPASPSGAPDDDVRQGVRVTWLIHSREVHPVNLDGAGEGFYSRNGIGRCSPHERRASGQT
jgi:hypothetical protein